MSSLICDLRAEAAALADEYLQLRAAGEPLALYWPAVNPLPGPGFAAATDAVALDACFEDERVAVLAGAALPAWLSVDEFHRVLLVSAAAELPPRERATAAWLLAHGCEAVDVLAPAALGELMQSWHSGRRTGARRLTAV